MQYIAMIKSNILADFGVLAKKEQQPLGMSLKNNSIHKIGGIQRNESRILFGENFAFNTVIDNSIECKVFSKKDLA